MTNPRGNLFFSLASYLARSLHYYPNLSELGPTVVFLKFYLVSEIVCFSCCFVRCYALILPFCSYFQAVEWKGTRCLWKRTRLGQFQSIKWVDSRSHCRFLRFQEWAGVRNCFVLQQDVHRRFLGGGGGGKAWVEKRYGEDGITYLLKGGAKQTGHGIQLFRERLSEKGHATIPKGIVGGFVCPVLQRNLKEWHERPRTYVRKCKWKATRVGSTATVVRNSVLIISL